MDSLKKLVALQPLTGKEWYVYSFVLNNDSSDELKGLFFILGCFATYQQALNHLHYLIEETGVKKLGIARYSAAICLQHTTDSVEIVVDTKDKLIKFDNQQFNDEKKRAEEKRLRDEEMLEECEKECDESTIEHLKRNIYLTLKHHSLIEDYQQKISQLNKVLETRKAIVTNHLKLYPEHEQQILPYLKEKLVRRGEEDLYHHIEELYQKYY